MGRHSRDEDPAPRRADRPADPRRPTTGGPSKPTGPPRQASVDRPAPPTQPRPTAQPTPPRPIPKPPRPISKPSPRLPTAEPFPPRPTADQFPPRPAADPGERSLRTGFHPHPDLTPPPHQSGFHQRPDVERPGSAFPPRSPGEATGSHAAAGERTGGHPAISTGGYRATSTGNFPAGSAEPHPAAYPAASTVTSTGSRRVVATATGTGSHPTVGESTGSHRRVAGGAVGLADAPEETGTQRRVGESTERRSGVSAGQTATGYHRATGKTAGRRRIAKWPIVAGAFVVLLVVGSLGWGWANSVLNSRAEAQANGCAEGDATMKVLVTPAVDKPVAAAAARWNQARTVVHAHCIHIDVTPMASDRALDALTGRATLDSIGGLPAAWIAENASSISHLQTADPAMIAAPAESVATGPSADYQFVGLTGPNLDEVQARAAQVFRDYLREPGQRADFTAAGLTSQ